jgi:predicted TIM-barrel fold metal-dependent hydrolase
MAAINKQGGPVVCFGAMHPDFQGFEEELEFLRLSGIKGIKMHSEYQGFRPEDGKYAKLFECCAANNIAVLFHSGVDIGYPTVRCTPKGAAELLSVKGLTVILAHMGAYRLWDEVEKVLVGRNCYFDLAYCNEMDNSQLKRMILNHGSDKILFATDFPWERACVIKKKVDALGLDQKDLDNIYFENASRLLNL